MGDFLAYLASWDDEVPARIQIAEKLAAVGLALAWIMTLINGAAWLSRRSRVSVEGITGYGGEPHWIESLAVP